MSVLIFVVVVVGPTCLCLREGGAANVNVENPKWYPLKMRWNPD